MKTNLDSKFKTNLNDEIEGKWFEVSEDTSFKLKRLGVGVSKRHQIEYQEFFKPYAAQFANNTIDPETELDLSMKAFAHTIISDWKGVIVDDEEVEFDKDLAYDILKEMPDLFDILLSKATKRENYIDSLGNS